MNKKRQYIIQLILVLSGTLAACFLQSCCKCCSSSLSGPTSQHGEIKYEHKITLSNTSEVFKQVIFPDHQLTENPNEDTIPWKVFVNPTRTVMYIQTNKGWDTLMYEIIVPKPEYKDPECGIESISTTISDPVVVFHTFDSVFIKVTTRQVPSRYNSYVSDNIITTALIIKNQ